MDIKEIKKRIQKIDRYWINKENEPPKLMYASSFRSSKASDYEANTPLYCD